MASQQRSTTSLTPTLGPCSYGSPATSGTSPDASPMTALREAIDAASGALTRAQLHAAADAYGLIAQHLRDAADMKT